METSEVGAKENSQGVWIRGGTEQSGEGGPTGEGLFHLGAEETDGGMRTGCHDGEEGARPVAFSPSVFLPRSGSQTPSHPSPVLDRPAHKGIYLPPFH